MHDPASTKLIYTEYAYTLFLDDADITHIFKGALSGLRQFLAAKSLLKMMKNAFYFTSKALFVFQIFKFFLDFLIMQQNGLIRRIRLISNFMMSQPG